MEILEDLEKLKKELEQAQADTIEPELTEEEQPVEELPEAEKVVEEVETQDSAEEVEEKQPEPSATEEKPDNAAMARMRRELAAAKKRAEELEATIAKPVEAKAADVEPDKTVNYQSWLEWKIRSLENQISPVIQRTEAQRQIDETVQAIDTLESAFRSQAPDYDDVMEGYKMQLKAGLEAVYPYATPEQINAEMGRQIIATSKKLAQDGLNPVEELYYIAKERGYAPRRQEPAVEAVETPRRPDLAKVAANRQRNAGMAASTGASKPKGLTAQEAASLSPSEWAKLTVEEKRQLLPNLIIE